ncbi:MAG: hypothetical protein C5B50_04095 [Verrucomicrobia bacterium]|nr:MAG: hypothetical protein C5B50_04095 [Verrucomicrobiota bacterium]
MRRNLYVRIEESKTPRPVTPIPATPDRTPKKAQELVGPQGPNPRRPALLNTRHGIIIASPTGSTGLMNRSMPLNLVFAEYCLAVCVEKGDLGVLLLC